MTSKVCSNIHITIQSAEAAMAGRCLILLCRNSRAGNIRADMVEYSAEFFKNHWGVVSSGSSACGSCFPGLQLPSTGNSSVP